jgi:hypothetical protein
VKRSISLEGFARRFQHGKAAISLFILSGTCGADRGTGHLHSRKNGLKNPNFSSIMKNDPDRSGSAEPAFPAAENTETAAKKTRGKYK